MPSYVHNVQIVRTAESATVNNGDAFALIPTSNQTSVLGAGSSITGDAVIVGSFRSATRVEDQEFIDISSAKAGGAS